MQEGPTSAEQGRLQDASMREVQHIAAPIRATRPQETGH